MKSQMIAFYLNQSLLVFVITFSQVPVLSQVSGKYVIIVSFFMYVYSLGSTGG